MLIERNLERKITMTDESEVITMETMSIAACPFKPTGCSAFFVLCVPDY